MNWTELMHMYPQVHTQIRYTWIGEGNGNPLQCSCLGNPMERGAWWATEKKEPIDIKGHPCCGCRSKSACLTERLDRLSPLRCILLTPMALDVPLPIPSSSADRTLTDTWRLNHVSLEEPPRTLISNGIKVRLLSLTSMVPSPSPWLTQLSSNTQNEALPSLNTLVLF